MASHIMSDKAVGETFRECLRWTVQKGVIFDVCTDLSYQFYDCVAKHGLQERVITSPTPKMEKILVDVFNKTVNYPAAFHERLDYEVSKAAVKTRKEWFATLHKLDDIYTAMVAVAGISGAARRGDRRGEDSKPRGASGRDSRGARGAASGGAAGGCFNCGGNHRIRECPEQQSADGQHQFSSHQRHSSVSRDGGRVKFDRDQRASGRADVPARGGFDRRTSHRDRPVISDGRVSAAGRERHGDASGDARASAHASGDSSASGRSRGFNASGVGRGTGDASERAARGSNASGVGRGSSSSRAFSSRVPTSGGTVDGTQRSTDADGEIIIDNSSVTIPFILDCGANRTFVSRRQASQLMRQPQSELIELATKESVLTASMDGSARQKIRTTLNLKYPSGVVHQLKDCDVFILDGLAGAELLIGRPSMFELGYLGGEFPGLRTDTALSASSSSTRNASGIACAYFSRIRFDDESQLEPLSIVVSPNDVHMLPSPVVGPRVDLEEYCDDDRIDASIFDDVCDDDSSSYGSKLRALRASFRSPVPVMPVVPVSVSPVSVSPPPVSPVSSASTVSVPLAVPVIASGASGDDDDDILDFDVHDPAAVLQQLHLRCDEAEAAGLPRGPADRLRAYVTGPGLNTFRLVMSNDPPADVPPIHIEFDKDVVSTSRGCRRYSTDDTNFMAAMTNKLVAFNYVRPNQSATVVSPAYPVVKANASASAPIESRMRLTVDYRRVNKSIKPAQFPLPNPDSLINGIGENRYFGTLDLQQGFWQLPLDEECQEYFSFVTDRGVFTPLRLMQGCTDGPGQFHGAMMRPEVLGEAVDDGKVKVFIDDILVMGQTPDDYVSNLISTIERLRRRLLKLQVRKVVFYAPRVKYCGRIYSVDGVSFDTAFIESILDLAQPTTVAELRTFLATANWMRSSIIRYSELVAPLQALLTTALRLLPVKPKTAAKSFLLSTAGWAAVHTAAFVKIKESLAHSVTLAYPSDRLTTCVWTDASDEYWAGVVTQAEAAELQKPVLQQSHKPMAFVSGRFTGAQLKWPTVEKEGFAILQTLTRCSHLLRRPRGFELFTDHRNLQFLFYCTVEATICRQTGTMDDCLAWVQLLHSACGW